MNETAPATDVSSPSPIDQVLTTAPAPGQRMSPTVDAVTALGLPNKPSEDIEAMRQENITKFKLEKAAMQVTPTGLEDPLTITKEEGGALPPQAKKKPAAKVVETPAQAIEASKKAPAPSETPAETPAQLQAQHTQKIKIGNKEYTETEIQLLQQNNELLQRALAAPKSAEAPTPTPEPVQRAFTPEQQAERVQQLRAQEAEWVNNNMKHIELDPVSEDMLENILNGGPDALTAFQELRQRDAARAVLIARKSIYEEMGPVLDRIEASQQPLHQYHQQVQEQHAARMFSEAYPDLNEYHMPLVTQVAQRLISQYPEEVSKLTLPEFIDELARQTEHNLNKNAKVLGFESWRDTPKFTTPADVQRKSPAAQAPAPVAAAPTPQAVPQGRVEGRVTSTPAVSPKSPAASVKRALPPSTPSGMNAPSTGKSWQQSIAQGLR
jgi:hypothetical protein